jgi:hypothetical protein
MIYRIYGKYKDQKKFRAMNLSLCIQVENLIHASLVDASKLDDLLKQLNKNEGWIFEARVVK